MVRIVRRGRMFLVLVQTARDHWETVLVTADKAAADAAYAKALADT